MSAPAPGPLLSLQPPACLSAPAKLNLFLHVTGRRPDGYHLLQSVFVPIDWADTLHLHPRTDGLLRRIDLSGLLPADDLCLRAARLLQHESLTRFGVDIQIDKQLPTGAGMGGGSSDAATVLHGLNQLWGLHWPHDRLERIGARLGADVPFFVRGRAAWVEGIGEIIRPIALPAEVLHTPVAVLKPAASLATSAVFGSDRIGRDTPVAELGDFEAAPMRFGRNDLELPATSLIPEISQALSLMQQRFGNARMTGSGSAVFSWVDQAATGAALDFGPESLGLDPTSWTGRLCRILARSPLLDEIS